MYIQHGKLMRKPVSLENDIDLLSKFPLGGLMGGEILKNYHTLIALPKRTPKVRVRRSNKNMKRFRKEEEFMRTRIDNHI